MDAGSEDFLYAMHHTSNLRKPFANFLILVGYVSPLVEVVLSTILAFSNGHGTAVWSIGVETLEMEYVSFHSFENPDEAMCLL